MGRTNQLKLTNSPQAWVLRPDWQVRGIFLLGYFCCDRKSSCLQGSAFSCLTRDRAVARCTSVTCGRSRGGGGVCLCVCALLLRFDVYFIIIDNSSIQLAWEGSKEYREPGEPQEEGEGWEAVSRWLGCSARSGSQEKHKIEVFRLSTIASGGLPLNVNCHMATCSCPFHSFP